MCYLLINMPCLAMAGEPYSKIKGVASYNVEDHGLALAEVMVQAIPRNVRC